MKKLSITTILLLFIYTALIAQQPARTGYTVSDKIHESIGLPSVTTGERTVECDTLRYPLPGQILYYILIPPSTGYITGNNSFKDKSKAEFFSSFEAGSTINGMIAEFVVAKNVHSPQITFAIWNNSGSNGKPGNIVASVTKPLASIASDVTNGSATYVAFDQPYTVTGPFYAGVVLPTQEGDTIALWCREMVAGYTGTAWEQWEDGNWYAFNDPASWGTEMLTSMTIHPISCKTVGIAEHPDPEVKIHPNPANGVVNITTWKSQETIDLAIFGMNGQKVYARSYPGAFTNFNIDLSFLPKGVYMIRLSDGKRQHSQKLILE